MKTLPEVVDDLQALAAFLIDQAEQINEVVSFFGGVTATKPKVTPPPPRPPAAAPPAPPPPPLVQVAQIPAPEPQFMEPHVHWNPGQQPYYSEVPEEEQQPEEEKKARKRSDTGSRALSKEEKAGIRKDWESLPKHLRTVDNRRALASKWRCSGIQVFALVREDGHGHRLAMSRRSATALPGGPETRRN